jgi:hypothetical protein
MKVKHGYTRGLLPMNILAKSVLLFALNMFDAVLTLIWIRMNVATEGNALMARVLEYGEFPFLSVKLLIGAIAAYVLYRFAHLKVARRGLQVALAVYMGLMLIHLATGLSAIV